MDHEERQWRENLAVGSKLDALKIDHILKVTCWSPASVSSKIGDKVVVTFDNDVTLCDR